MIFDKNISPYVVVAEEPILSALHKIDQNEDGLVICVDENGILQGVLTDGDFRRWLIQTENKDLSQKVSLAINREVVFAEPKESFSLISSKLNSQIRFVPLVDDKKRLIGIARERTKRLIIGPHVVGPEHPCLIVAEIGNNHNGDFELACRLIDLAIEAGADCVKFQLRNLEALYANRGKAADAAEDLGSQYTLDLLNRYQLPIHQMLHLFDYCREKNIEPICTPWDKPSLDVLEKYEMNAYKTASADFINHDLLIEVAATGKPMICSTGMTTQDEIEESISLLKDLGAHFMLLHCNSTYPAPHKDLNLRFMEWLQKKGDCPVGYSSHERGINGALAAKALGAVVIEKHFTLDQNMEGNDHKISLLPGEFKQMVKGVREVEESLGNPVVKSLSQGEIINKESLGKSIWITKDLQAGQVFEESMLEIRSPGKGLSPNYKKGLVGKEAKRDLKVGDLLSLSDIDGSFVKPRNYKFRRPFGIPIRYHDLHALGRQSNFDFLEFHLSYQDLNVEIKQYIQQKWKMGLVVHAPELFEGDHLLDLCASEPSYRTKSIEHMKRVIDVTKQLRQWFKCPLPTLIIVNVGGHTPNRFMAQNEKNRCYEKVGEAFERLQDAEVELIPQTMPPFPWHFGGQRLHNLFVYGDEISRYCSTYQTRICLDISHSKLACNHLRCSFDHFVQKVAPYTAHLHLADASGIDGEGLQIQAGEIDWFTVSRILDNYPASSFIPEIWQGHKHGGADVWRALEILEKYF